jgi:nitrite reductase/ring-hydroxylating ferredoxin subunit
VAAAAGLSRRPICAGDELADGGRGVRFAVANEGSDLPAFVVRFGGKVHAYLNRCSHLAVELDWQAGEFFDVSGLYLICATHGALYAPDSGDCVGGPCNGRGLVALPVIEDGGIVYLIGEGKDSG